MPNTNSAMRELTTSELDAVSGGAAIMTGTKIRISMDKGTIEIGYISYNGGTSLPYAIWTPK
jgi:hypothetical protein